MKVKHKVKETISIKKILLNVLICSFIAFVWIVLVAGVMSLLGYTNELDLETFLVLKLSITFCLFFIGTSLKLLDFKTKKVYHEVRS